MTEIPVKKGVLVEIITEVETQIRSNSLNKGEKAQLFHELGSLYGMIGDLSQQKFAWQQAAQLCPDNDIIRQSLESIES